MDKGQDAPPPAYPAATAPPPGGAPPPQGYQPQPAGYSNQPPPPWYAQQQYGQPPPPAPGYAQQPGGTTVVVTQPAPMMFREAPVVMTCPHCRANITTSQTYENGTLTWVAIGGLCFVGCWLGCCLIPLCVNSLKDVKHSCPNCSKLVGSYNRM